MIEQSVKTRFAPSPTGRLHVGNTRAALFNYLFARHYGGDFLLRIEDTDAARSDSSQEQQLQADLQWLGLDWDAGPEGGVRAASARQSERMGLYATQLQRLRDAGQIYPCFCSAEELARVHREQRAAGRPPRYPGTCAGMNPTNAWARMEQGEAAALRFRVPPDGATKLDDLVRGPVRFSHRDLDDFIVARGDGTVGFLFANAVDDALMGVTHALRGEDHLANTPRQLMLLAALGLIAPAYGHLALIVGEDGAPLSKRNGSRSLAELRAAGYLPSAVNNYLARLGHTLDAHELLSLSELARGFEVSRLGRAAARFDAAQLEHWQTRAVSRAADAELLAWDQNSHVPAAYAANFLALVRPNVRFPADLRDWAGRLFGEPFLDADAAEVLASADGICATALRLRAQGVLDWAAFQTALRRETGRKGRALFMPLRAALTGTTHGPELAGVIELLGEREVQARLGRAAEWAPQHAPTPP